MLLILVSFRHVDPENVLCRRKPVIFHWFYFLKTIRLFLVNPVFASHVSQKHPAAFQL